MKGAEEMGVEKRYDYITPKDFEIAEINGITKSALEQRVYVYKWDVERAITEPMKVRRKVDHLWNEWEIIATENGITKLLFNRRIKVPSNWTAEKAATTPIGKGRPVNVEWTKEERETAKKNGLDKNHMNAVRARIRSGWTREDAINTPILSETERAKRVAEGTRDYHKKNKRVLI